MATTACELLWASRSLRTGVGQRLNELDAQLLLRLLHARTLVKRTRHSVAMSQSRASQPSQPAQPAQPAHASARCLCPDDGAGLALLRVGIRILLTYTLSLSLAPPVALSHSTVHTQEPCLLPTRSSTPCLIESPSPESACWPSRRIMDWVGWSCPCCRRLPTSRLSRLTPTCPSSETCWLKRDEHNSPNDALHTPSTSVARRCAE